MDLRDWVLCWSGKYPNPPAEDDLLAKFNGVEFLTRPQAEELISWKFQTDPRRRKRTHNLFATESDDRIHEMTKRAFAGTGDYDALLACTSLKGIGPATGSVFLMAQSPENYTVIDIRALKSVRGLDRLPSGPADARVEHWGPYLTACRKIAEETGLSLRVVDRAMYMANGRVDCPEDDR
jgi:hypothetical protein